MARSSDLHAAAVRILASSPGAVVRVRLLRDVLGVPASDRELQKGQRELNESRMVRELSAEQWDDGSWGAFHSQDTKRKQKIITTEVGVERALALGLDASHPVLAKAAEYILSIMHGKRRFPDTHEVNDRWQTGMRLFLASTLARINPAHPILEQDRQLWMAIAERTFRSGSYSVDDEIQAHKELTGATVKGSYLVLNGRYQLNLLGSQPGALSPALESALLSWLWGRPDGIGYLGERLAAPQVVKPPSVDRWLSSHELLARGYPAWVEFAQPVIEWLWARRGVSGWWDFGPRPRAYVNLPLSNSWRKRVYRRQDWSARVLCLLAKGKQAI